MSYIYSNKILAQGGYNRKIRNFVAVLKSNNKISIKKKLAQEVCLNETCILGYDPDTNKLIIIPSLDGDIHVHWAAAAPPRYLLQAVF